MTTDAQYKYIYDDTTYELVRIQKIEHDSWGNEVKYPCETYVVPPVIEGERKVQIFDVDNNKWNVVEDYRNVEVYINGKELTIWREVGPLPENTTLKFMQYTNLEDAKTQKLDEIKTYTDIAKNNGFEYNGDIYDSDTKSYIALSAYDSAAKSAKLAGVKFDPVMWTLKNNEEVLLSNDDLMNIVKAYADHLSKVQNYSTVLKNAIKGIVIPTGNEPVEERERIAIEQVANYDISFASVVPEGCDPVVKQ